MERPLAFASLLGFGVGLPGDGDLEVVADWCFTPKLSQPTLENPAPGGSPAWSFFDEADEAYDRADHREAASSVAMVGKKTVLTSATTKWRELRLISGNAELRHSGAWLGSVLFGLPSHVSCRRILGLIADDSITLLAGYESADCVSVKLKRIES
ncbi:MAG: hypothetical protein JNL18_01060 [Planctomycetaceae bacterium]|nr:hypothetical protein [Planctomycetaceae bacterium]